MDRFIELVKKIDEYAKINLKSNMDRFIDHWYADLHGNILI